MAVEVGQPGVKPLKNERYLDTKLERAAGEHKDQVAKWERDHPGKPDGYSFKRNTDKSWSRQLVPTETFRAQFDAVCWCSEGVVSPRCAQHA